MPVLSLRSLRADREPGLVARAAYDGRRRLYDRARARSYDFSRRPGLVWSELTLPAGVPGDWIDPERLWNAMGNSEPWGRPGLAREIVMGLPRGRTLVAHALFIGDFLEEAFVARGCAVDWSIHYDREWNLHAHALISPPWVGDGGARGLEEGAPQRMSPTALRALWQRHCTRQGLGDGVIPQDNSGARPAAAWALGRRGVVTRLSQRQLALRALAGHPFRSLRPPWLRIRWRRKDRAPVPREPPNRGR
ncbi:MAG: MobA/MobL family protein [Acidiferrobacter sp.]